MDIQKSNIKRKTKDPSRLLIPAILTCAVVLLACLYIAFEPFTLDDIRRGAKSAGVKAKEQFTALKEDLIFRASSSKSSLQTIDAAQYLSEFQSDPTPYISMKREQGSVESLRSEDEETFDQTYLFMLDTSLGPMIYFHQGDSRWGDFLYGGQDPLKKYGCGPTAVAMVINSFSQNPVSPADLAQWSAENGYYALHGGSYHSLVPDSLEAYGLSVESVTNRTPEYVAELLDSGHILVALMGQGTFTKKGHFVLITKLLENGNVSIADPANYENCTMEWDLELLLSELKRSYDHGGPLWAVKP